MLASTCTGAPGYCVNAGFMNGSLWIDEEAQKRFTLVDVG